MSTDWLHLSGLAAGDPAFWLPIVFIAVLAFALLAYVVLDGYDLGIGLLLPRSVIEIEQDAMVAAAGSVWDANETWLAIALGVLVAAFPLAGGDVLAALYLPMTCMLAGLALRGVALDYRVKAPAVRRRLWNRLFWLGSVLVAGAQGYMLGRIVTGQAPGLAHQLFACFVGAATVAAYALLGATWLVMRTTGPLQRRAVRWARRTAWLVAAGIAAVAVVLPLMSTHVLHKWVAVPQFFLMLPVPVVTLLAFAGLELALRRLPVGDDRLAWVPFALVVTIVVCAFVGVGYSLVPYLVMDRVTIWEGAATPDALRLLAWGAAIALPLAALGNVVAHRVFRGQPRSALGYD